MTSLESDRTHSGTHQRLSSSALSREAGHADVDVPVTVGTQQAEGDFDAAVDRRSQKLRCPMVASRATCRAPV